ncbi:hypothetical protein FGG08_001758 [Glutinoglossum americanum]|uniref:ubiquitinyl hydrolase 1 n=1 Tax=Glutinoglossum americanum TaxID=1670608 RepID=A0A9P8IAK0_9PEZI|nr:hypothetical protein FGG08_001758 [Glutinoglossum americanum]
MADRAKRRRINVKNVANGNGPASATSVAITGGMDPPFLAAKAEDRLNWAGWCEIESEPVSQFFIALIQAGKLGIAHGLQALFSVMLREFGVKGVKVQEVFTMDEEVLAGLNKPVHGLIFLFRWREDDPDKQEPSCPEEVWFANQTNSNACATIALLNIVNNIPSIDLGENLESFKQFSKDLTPALRGYSIGNFEFARQVHNSFARKMDMFNIDMALRNDATAKAQRGGYVGENNGEAGFHFIALVPIGDHVWKLDGLERQPQRLGKIGKRDWLDLATPIIQEMMMRYASDEEQFVLLAVVQDPLKTLQPQLAENIAALDKVNERLNEITPGWREHEAQNDADDNIEDAIQGPDAAYGITADMIGCALINRAVSTKLGSDKAEKIMALRSELIQEQRMIRSEIRSEEQTQAEEAEKAASRRHDYGAAIHTWLKMLFRKGELKPLLEEMDLLPQGRR